MLNLPGVHNLGSAPLSVAGTLDLTTGGAGQLSVGNVSLNSATLNLVLNGSNTALTGGAITVSGANTVNVYGSSYLNGNTYTLISGSSLDTSAGSFTLGTVQLFGTLTPQVTSTAYQVKSTQPPPRQRPIGTAG